MPSGKVWTSRTPLTQRFGQWHVLPFGAVAASGSWSSRARIFQFGQNTLDDLLHLPFLPSETVPKLLLFISLGPRQHFSDGANISVTARPDDPSCPISALRHHLACNVNIPSSAPLFAFETANGGWAPMTKPWFMSRCNTIWTAAGLPEMPGHSFRIGGATYLLLLGNSPDIVAVQGRWRSRAFLEYWREIDQSCLYLFLLQDFLARSAP